MFFFDQCSSGRTRLCDEGTEKEVYLATLWLEREDFASSITIILISFSLMSFYQSLAPFCVFFWPLNYH